MSSKNEKELSKIINYIQKNQTSSINYRFLDQDLLKCELRIDKYEHVRTRALGKTAVLYTFKTNDKDCYEDLLLKKKPLIEVSQELLDDDYELVFDDDGDPIIEIKYVDEELDYIQAAPKITFENCVDIVIKNLEDAQVSIIGAVAWITNKKILDVLVEKANEGVLINLIADNNKRNIDFRNNNPSYKILPFPISYVTNMNRDIWGNNATMHLKYCIIDTKKVLYGTFNWTERACINDEDIHEDSNPSSIKTYIDKYYDLCKKYNTFYDYDICVR